MVGFGSGYHGGYNPDEPRDERGRWTTGGATPIANDPGWSGHGNTMVYRCYLRDGLVYLPTVVKDRTGVYWIVDPVVVVSVFDVGALRCAFRDLVARGNVGAPALARSEKSVPTLARAAGVKTWSAFARGTLAWNFEENDGVYRIIPEQQDARHGFEEVPDRAVTLSPGSDVDALCDRMVAILHAAQQGRRV
jgi:hypothetical protein